MSTAANLFNALMSDDEEDEVKTTTQTKAKKASASQAKKTASKADQFIEPPASQQKDARRDNKDRRFGGRGAAEGGRGGRGGGRGGKREFDRRSGTGRGREEKRGGGGGHNWGKADATDATPMDSENAEGAEKTEGEEAEREEEPQQLGLDQYQATLEESRQGENFEELSVRKVGKKQFAGAELMASKKDNDDDAFIQMGAGKAQKRGSGKKKEKTVLDIGNAPRSGGRGRGGGRGFGGRGGHGGHNKDYAFNENDFPSMK